MVRAFLIEAAVVLLLVCVPPIAEVFGQAAPPWWGWLFAACAFPVVIIADLLAKSLLTRRRHRASR